MAGGVVATLPPPLEPDDDPDVAPGATCVLPSLSIVVLATPATFCVGHRALRVDELVHAAGEVVGAVHREVHAVTGAHGDDLAGLVGEIGRELAVGVGEQLVGVDVLHLGVALRHLLRDRVDLDHRGVHLLVLQRG